MNFRRKSVLCVKPLIFSTSKLSFPRELEYSKNLAKQVIKDGEVSCNDRNVYHLKTNILKHLPNLLLSVSMLVKSIPLINVRIALKKDKKNGNFLNEWIDAKIRLLHFGMVISAIVKSNVTL